MRLLFFQMDVDFFSDGNIRFGNIFQVTSRSHTYIRMKVLILLCLAAMALADGYVSLTVDCYHYILSFRCTGCLTQVVKQNYS